MDDATLLRAWRGVENRTDSPYTDLYAHAAEKMGWQTEVLGGKRSCRIKVMPPGGVPFEIHRHNVHILYHRPTINLCRDKRLTHKFLLKNSIACPRSVFIRDAHDFRSVGRDAGMKYPLVVKPVRGTKGLGVELALGPKTK